MELYTVVHVSLKDICYIHTTTEKIVTAAVFNFFFGVYFIILINFKWIFVCSHSKLFYLKQMCLEDIQNAERKSKEKLFKQNDLNLIFDFGNVSFRPPVN